MRRNIRRNRKAATMTTRRGIRMRYNQFREAYCHTADEARARIEAHGASVYAPGDICDADGDDQATVEIADSVTGDLVCFIEAPTMEGVDAILAQIEVA
jgi:hypothetical protein